MEPQIRFWVILAFQYGRQCRYALLLLMPTGKLNLGTLLAGYMIDVVFGPNLHHFLSVLY